MPRSKLSSAAVRSFVGIDLGTTNSALAYIRAPEGGDREFPAVHVLEIPQAIAENAQEPRRTLPSFLYLSEPPMLGVFAREQGALTPTKLVHSAKSWLSNPAVDRTAKILPWEASEGGRLWSPVEVSSRILSTMREAWDRTQSEPLASHEVVLTVPASFDEEARELTVMSARDAGIENLTLLEEPAAAFYSWIANHLSQSHKDLFDGQLVLVCDVGGGTSDFTLIRVTRQGEKIDFTRTSVGRHLLLGGDNLDLTLAWLAESKLGSQLSVRQRSALRRQCSAAKEKLLADASVDKVDITVLGAGRSLIGGTLRTEITREEALELALDGFLPFCERGERPLPQDEEMSPFGELGLPYESDAAVTRHLSAFLEDAGAAKPDAVLFNGGFFIPDLLRGRVADVLERWHGRRPLILENRDLDLAVAVGAAYYNYGRSTGAGLLVRGGLPRAYFIGLETGETVKAVTVAPRGTIEGDVLELDVEGLQLVANKAVTFRLYSSLTRLDDEAGKIVEFPLSEVEAGRMHLHAPLHAVIRFGKPGAERGIPVKLGARLTEVGTLELWADSKLSEHRWKLQFELRKAASTAVAKPAAVIADASLAAALELLRDTFERQSLAPEELPSRLEQALALGRNSWPLSAIRRMGDLFLELSEGRKLSPGHEARWLNLCGLCLRPGFGYPGDDYRIEQVRRIFAGGLVFGSAVQNQSEWWIFWGRLAGGLNRNQQGDLYQRLAATLLPRKNAKIRVNSSLLREMWRCASSLELLPSQTRTDLGEELLRRVKAGDFQDSELWCLARLGSRNLFYGPANQVLSAGTVARWVDALVKVDRASEIVASLAQRTGDLSRDLPPATIDLARASLQKHADAERLLALLAGRGGRDSQSMNRIFGEELPSGLMLGNDVG
ncbi:MAG: Hsp70 family protein [Acidobacteriia bacterium]|nr:Hsp70 family protein [Terriglobia bacterium]